MAQAFFTDSEDMSAVDGGSVPPPGWGEIKPELPSPVVPEAAVSVPASVSPFVSAPLAVSGQPPTDAAVEYRISAAIVDNLILLALYGVVCGLLHWRFVTLTHELVLLALNVAYYFTLESRDGQTIGKRMQGIRVVAVDGSPAAPKAIAIRSVLRIIDAIPIWYLSGLVNMVRTGPRRRQRIGDFVAETKVIAVAGRALTRGTPGWVLPAATLCALCASALNVYAIANAKNQPLTSQQQTAFVAGCERTSQGAFDCQCLLDRLESDGYTTLSSISTVVQQARAEEFSDQTGSARTEIANAAIACHQ